mgnify:CR=1 FL=1
MRDGLRRVLIWEVIGAIFIIVGGSLIHFLYEWSNHSQIVAIFSPINESLWEHHKLGLWSVALFSLIEYWFIRDYINNFITAKVAGILSLQLLIVIGFYLYTSFIDRSILLLDILLYVIGAVICQVISYEVLTRKRVNRAIKYTAVLILILHLALSVFFTYFRV